VDAIIRTWLDRGWLETGADSGRGVRASKMTRVGGASVRAIVVTREAFNALGA
jgi:hypothetical protein